MSLPLLLPQEVSAGFSRHLELLGLFFPMQNKLPEQATLILVGEIGKEEQEQRLVPEKQNYVSWGY